MFGRKHRFSFFKKPKFEDTLEFNGDRKLFIALALKIAKSFSWRKINSNPINLEFRSTEKWSSNSLIVIEYKANNHITIFSETIADQRWDLGRNFLKVRDFKRALNDAQNQLTEIDKRNIQDTDENLLGYFDYVEPRSFKSTLERSNRNKSHVHTYCGILVITTGVLFGYLKYLDLFLLFTREMLFAFSLWFTIYIGAKYGKIHSYKYLKRLAFISVLSFYVIQFITYQCISILSDPGSFDLLNYIQQEFSILTNQLTDRIGQKVLITALMAGIIGYLFFSNLKLSLSKLKKNEIPEEVLTYAEFLVARGDSNYQIKNKLTEKGIIDFQLHNQILEVIRPKEGIVS